MNCADWFHSLHFSCSYLFTNSHFLPSDLGTEHFRSFSLFAYDHTSTVCSIILVPFLLFVNEPAAAIVQSLFSFSFLGEFVSVIVNFVFFLQCRCCCFGFQDHC